MYVRPKRINGLETFFSSTQRMGQCWPCFEELHSSWEGDHFIQICVSPGGFPVCNWKESWLTSTRKTSVTINAKAWEFVHSMRERRPGENWRPIILVETGASTHHHFAPLWENQFMAAGGETFKHFALHNLEQRESRSKTSHFNLSIWKRLSS